MRRPSCELMLEVESPIFRAQRRISLIISAAKDVALPRPSVPARLCCKPAVARPRFELRPVEAVTGDTFDREFAVHPYVWMEIQGHRHAKGQWWPGCTRTHMLKCLLDRRRHSAYLVRVAVRVNRQLLAKPDLPLPTPRQSSKPTVSPPQCRHAATRNATVRLKTSPLHPSSSSAAWAQRCAMSAPASAAPDPSRSPDG